MNLNLIGQAHRRYSTELQRLVKRKKNACLLPRKMNVPVVQMNMVYIGGSETILARLHDACYGKEGWKCIMKAIWKASKISSGARK